MVRRLLLCIWARSQKGCLAAENACRRVDGSGQHLQERIAKHQENEAVAIYNIVKPLLRQEPPLAGIIFFEKLHC